jgi:hypothetical protein
MQEGIPIIVAEKNTMVACRFTANNSQSPLRPAGTGLGLARFSKFRPAANCLRLKATCHVGLNTRPPSRAYRRQLRAFAERWVAIARFASRLRPNGAAVTTAVVLALRYARDSAQLRLHAMRVGGWEPPPALHANRRPVVSHKPARMKLIFATSFLIKRRVK